MSRKQPPYAPEYRRQMEAMSMVDRIIVMNHGVIEQIGTPQEIYDRPRTMFIADFIGSPSMSFLRFEGAVEAEQSSRASPPARPPSGHGPSTCASSAPPTATAWEGCSASSTWGIRTTSISR